LNGLTTELTRDIEARSEQLAAELRYLMLAGLIVASGLALALGYLVSARRPADRMVIEAQRQTQDILKTVKDGCSCSTRPGIGPRTRRPCSCSSARDARRHYVEDLLRPLVPEKTMQTALKFVKVLWSSAHAKISSSRSPACEVEVNFDDGRGGHATRYLEFDFHRVKSEERVDKHPRFGQDVSQRVMLARELRIADKAQARSTRSSACCTSDPAQLSSFLDDSDAAMRMVNSILRSRRRRGRVRKKLDSIFRQVHAVKGEASALASRRSNRAASDVSVLRSEAESSATTGASRDSTDARPSADASPLTACTWRKDAVELLAERALFARRLLEDGVDMRIAAAESSRNEESCARIDVQRRRGAVSSAPAPCPAIP